MNQSDKDKLLPRLGDLADVIDKIFKDERNQTSALWAEFRARKLATYLAPFWGKNRLGPFSFVDRWTRTAFVGGCITSIAAIIPLVLGLDSNGELVPVPSAVRELG